ncbi:MAG: isopentenyl phosphate kinase [Candidatus Micrarchaeia archaeon]
MQIFFLKLGGSIITNTKKAYTADLSTMRRVFAEIKQARSINNFDLVLGHGGGSFPHIPAHKYKVNEGLVYEFSRKGTSITHLVAQDLNKIVVNEGIRLGLSPFAFSPSSFALWSNGTAKEGYVGNILEALQRGFMPVVYGDAVIDDFKGAAIASTENVFEFMARSLRPRRVVLATDVDGVFDKDPVSNTDARLIRKIDHSNISKVLGGAGSSHKVDVTGGMFSKLATLYSIVKSTNATGIILNGKKPGLIRKALSMRKVTLGNYTVVLP